MYNKESNWKNASAQKHRTTEAKNSKPLQKNPRKIFLNCRSSITAGGYQLQGLYFITDLTAAQ